MNAYRLLTSALCVSSLALPLGFAADTSPGASDANQPYQRQSGEIAIHRVTQEELKQDLTAKDFIGKSIYDSAGEKLGEILDLHLSIRLAGDAAREMSRNDRTSGSSSSGSTTTSGSSSTSRSTTGSAASTAADMADRAGNAMRHMENVAYVSVGGLLGMGNDVVTVPTSSLQFDAEKDRFTLNVRKADFVAIAKQEAPAYASSQGTNPSYAGPMHPNTSSAADDAVSMIRSAIQRDSTVGNLASRINISENDGAIVLSGRVDSQTQKDRLVTLARAATSKPVTDKLTVGTTTSP
jgi:osmotically-inducible protein OsmY